MTFAELIVFLAVAALLYRLLRPLQRRLERLIARLLRRVSGDGDDKPVITVMEFRRKD